MQLDVEVSPPATAMHHHWRIWEMASNCLQMYHIVCYLTLTRVTFDLDPVTFDLDPQDILSQSHMSNPLYKVIENKVFLHCDLAL